MVDLPNATVNISDTVLYFISFSSKIYYRYFSTVQNKINIQNDSKCEQNLWADILNLYLNEFILFLIQKSLQLD